MYAIIVDEGTTSWLGFIRRKYGYIKWGLMGNYHTRHHQIILCFYSLSYRTRVDLSTWQNSWTRLLKLRTTETATVDMSKWYSFKYLSNNEQYLYVDGVDNAKCRLYWLSNWGALDMTIMLNHDHVAKLVTHSVVAHLWLH